MNWQEALDHLEATGENAIASFRRLCSESNGDTYQRDAYRETVVRRATGRHDHQIRDGVARMPASPGQDESESSEPIGLTLLAAEFPSSPAINLGPPRIFVTGKCCGG